NQAEEALVHQGEALRRREVTEHELLEVSIRVRADAEEAAYALDAANGQMSASKQQVSALHETLSALRHARDERAKQAQTLRETLDHAPASAIVLREEVDCHTNYFVNSTKNILVNEYEPIIPFRAEDGVYARLDTIVEFRDPLGPAAKQFLPRLRAAYLTDNAV